MALQSKLCLINAPFLNASTMKTPTAALKRNVILPSQTRRFTFGLLWAVLLELSSVTASGGLSSRIGSGRVDRRGSRKMLEFLDLLLVQLLTQKHGSGKTNQTTTKECILLIPNTLLRQREAKEPTEKRKCRKRAGAREPRRS